MPFVDASGDDGKPMQFELDHIFVFTTPGACEAELLCDHGLTEGEPNRHPGQGTANRRFFFSNIMLELAWVCDESEALSPPANQLHLVERSKWRENGASPFGLCFRPSDDTMPDDTILNDKVTGTPFPGWSYCPSYWGGASAHVGDNSDRLDEPLLFYMSFNQPPSDCSQPAKFRTVEMVRVHGWRPNPSPIAIALADVPGLELQGGSEPLMELQFGGHGAVRDFRPELPLIVRR